MRLGCTPKRDNPQSPASFLKIAETLSGGVMMSRRWARQEIEYLKRYYRKESVLEITKVLNRTQNAVITKADRIGLGKYKLKHDYFSNIDTEEKAWLLGFWAADGCVRKKKKAEISFAQKDYAIISKIKDILGAQHKIHQENEFCKISFSSNKMYLDLCSVFGMDICKKSLSIQWPKIKRKYDKDFLRGYIDGDGSLCFKRSNMNPILTVVSGSESIIDSCMETIFYHTGMSGYKQQKPKGSFQLSYFTIKAQCLSYWLYNGASSFLPRKMDIAHSFWSWKPKRINKNNLAQKTKDMFSQFIYGG